MSLPVITTVLAKLATKSGMLAAVGVVGASSVAAAAAGAPLPVLDEVFDDTQATLTDVEPTDEQLPDDQDGTGDAEDEGEDVDHDDEKESDKEPSVELAESEVEDGEHEGEDGSDEGESHGSRVSEAARSDCGKPDKGDGDDDDDDASATEVEHELDGESVTDEAEHACPEGFDGNHGEYVSGIAHEQRDAKHEERDARKAERDAEKAERKAARDAARADRKGGAASGD